MSDLAATGPFGSLTVRKGGGIEEIEFVVPTVHCPGCIAKIEKGLLAEPGVISARVNMSARRVAISWRSGVADADALAGVIENLGYEVRPHDPGEAADDIHAAETRFLLRSLAIAGFAAANVMLLSVSVWSGAEAATRDLFHWLSALIALPAIAFAGQPFFRSAWSALKVRSVNMDVPIALGVLLAAGMSLMETSRGSEHAYFDAALMLLFFLLVGRTLDHLMRGRARSAAGDLVRLMPRGARVVEKDGSSSWRLLSEVFPGMTVSVAAGERLPVDGVVLEGESALDRSHLTGEARPETVAPGAAVEAATLNLGNPLAIRVSAVGADTGLAEIAALMEAAEQRKGRYVRLAERAARAYAPAVHSIALLTFVGWLVAGATWQQALVTAIAVLIITCPCALGLAAPIVQVVAGGVLFRRGIFMKDGAALEKLAAADTAVFDKTGTLTRPLARPQRALGERRLALAAALAEKSLHPLSRALVSAAGERGLPPLRLDDVREEAGKGLSGRSEGRDVRLGSAAWCGVAGEKAGSLFFRVGDEEPVAIDLDETLRDDAAETVATLKALGVRPVLMTGDRAEAARRTARRLGIADMRFGIRPEEKAAAVEALTRDGRAVFMVGDGLNDAPALAAATVSMAPADAADIARTAADLVYVGERLGPVVFAHSIATSATRLMRQNFFLAAAYNVVAVPIAVLGHASPLVAAIAMSSSSVLVVANALRLKLKERRAIAGALPPSAHGLAQKVPAS